ncbi:high-affinity nitrate transporter 2.3 [Iris pallida]|uniref:High-affinity nitrate transporter 2.3 n=1 Tax=Iris pallida TaxID=29817 RepID=A0AAX6EA91_IRIPA|nr:high-affinity nitrate transporter 2.3 [Iris pallida]
MPDGNFKRLEKSGEKHKDSFANVFSAGAKNYRGWILAITYGYCFGVELTIDNIIAQYFYDRFDVDLHTAGIIAASFGLANLVSRPGGGWMSDVLGRRFGMRGRLWGLWVAQSVGGALCVLLGWLGTAPARSAPSTPRSSSCSCSPSSCRPRVDSRSVLFLSSPEEL